MTSFNPPLWYRRDGTPFDVPDHDADKEAWVEAMTEVENCLKDLEYRRVAATLLPNGLWVSTVWVGLDMGVDFSEDGEDYKPLIFETMVFDENNKKTVVLGKQTRSFAPSLDQDRYATEEEALKGHKRMVRKYAKH